MVLARQNAPDPVEGADKTPHGWARLWRALRKARAPGGLSRLPGAPHHAPAGMVYRAARLRWWRKVNNPLRTAPQSSCFVPSRSGSRAILMTIRRASSKVALELV